jgi:hypothetical protein
VALVAALAIAGPRLTLRGAAPILPPALFARPAFTAGIAVQLLFSLGLQGMFVVLALWLQAGLYYSPIKAGATAATFSIGAVITAALCVPLATRLGRYILITGAQIMAAGTYGLLLAAQHASHGVSPWQLVPGLIVAGAGLGLLPDRWTPASCRGSRPCRADRSARRTSRCCNAMSGSDP